MVLEIVFLSDSTFPFFALYITVHIIKMHKYLRHSFIHPALLFYTMSLSNQPIKSLPTLKKCKAEKSNTIKHQVVWTDCLVCIVHIVCCAVSLWVCVVTVFNLFKWAGIKGIQRIRCLYSNKVSFLCGICFFFCFLFLHAVSQCLFIVVSESGNLLSSQ